MPRGVEVFVGLEPIDLRCYAEPVVMRSCSLPRWSCSALGCLVRSVASSA